MAQLALPDTKTAWRRGAIPGVEYAHVITERRRLDLTILILTRNERENISLLVPKIWKIVANMGIEAEIVIIDASSDGTAEAATELGCRAVPQRGRGYGAAFQQGLEEVRGDFLLTIDADHSHEPEFLYHMWAIKDLADILIGSRYVPAGQAVMPLSRRVLSRVLNRVFSIALDLPYKDLSSGYRLYRRSVIEATLPLAGKDFDILEEILVKASCQGFRIREVPIYYRPRNTGRSNANAVKFAVSYLKTLKAMWVLRNGAQACDYDKRAFNSIVLPQRYWQRRRFSIILELIKGHNRCLDIGCGTSQITRSLPAIIGMDINLAKVRYLKSTNPLTVQGDAFRLPFRDGAFSAVLCSKMIEYAPKSDDWLAEIHRVLETDGKLILGTPDYSSRAWRWIEAAYRKVMPANYAEEHLSHYTREELEETLRRSGFEILSCNYILKSELILEARKRPSAAAASGHPESPDATGTEESI